MPSTGPALFVLVDEIPLTANGKVNLNALPNTEGMRPVLDVEYAPPQRGLEETIAALWQETLKVERVGVNDNFFDLGGHSLLMARVHNKLQAELKGKSRSLRCSIPQWAAGC